MSAKPQLPAVLSARELWRFSEAGHRISIDTYDGVNPYTFVRSDDCPYGIEQLFLQNEVTVRPFVNAVPMLYFITDGICTVSTLTGKSVIMDRLRIPLLFVPVHTAHWLTTEKYSATLLVVMELNASLRGQNITWLE